MGEIMARSCKFCGKQIKRNKYNGRSECAASLKKRQVCNMKCLAAFYKSGGYKKSDTGPGSRGIARKLKPFTPCEKCGGIEGKSVVHHIDFDCHNNDLSNLIRLCHRCHRGVHNKYYKQKCLICEKPQICKGYCDKHYRRVLKFGDPNIIRIYTPKNHKCKICGDKGVNKDYCNKHYRDDLKLRKLAIIDQQEYI